MTHHNKHGTTKQESDFSQQKTEDDMANCSDQANDAASFIPSAVNPNNGAFFRGASNPLSSKGN